MCVCGGCACVRVCMCRGVCSLYRKTLNKNFIWLFSLLCSMHVYAEFSPSAILLGSLGVPAFLFPPGLPFSVADLHVQ